MGRTGLFASEIGFGCGPGARLMVDGTPAEQSAAIQHALDRGITYFDTAANYGDGRSERHLGRALGSSGTRAIIATKVALEFHQLDDIYDAVTRSVEGSLVRLQREAVDIVYLHNRVARRRAAVADIGVGAMLTVADVLGDRGVVAALADLRMRGLVRHFGCCAFGGEAPAIRTLIASDYFASILVNYSLLNQTAFTAARGPKDRGRDYAAVAATAEERGMSAAALRVLEAGLLAGGAAIPETLGDVRGELQALRELAAESDLATIAIRFVLSNRAVATTIVGFSERRHIDHAADAAARGPLAADVLAQIERLRSA